MHKRGVGPAPHRTGRVSNEAPHQPTVQLCVEQMLTPVLSLMRKDAQGETDKWPKSEKRGGRKGGNCKQQENTCTERKCCRTDTAWVLDLEVTQVVSSNLQSVLVEQL